MIEMCISRNGLVQEWEWMNSRSIWMLKTARQTMPAIHRKENERINQNNNRSVRRWMPFTFWLCTLSDKRVQSQCVRVLWKMISRDEKKSLSTNFRQAAFEFLQIANRHRTHESCFFFIRFSSFGSKGNVAIALSTHFRCVNRVANVWICWYFIEDKVRQRFWQCSHNVSFA